MKGEKGGQHVSDGNTIDELSDESFGTQSLNTTILTEDGQHNVIYTAATFAPTQQVFKLN